MKTASVSVVVPCYCSSGVLARAVASVLEQNQRPLEIILVEDASPDGGETRDCIQELIAAHAEQDELSIRAIYLPKNLGPGGARNAGWNAARGDYVAFLDADDAWHPKKIEIQYAWMESHPQIDLSSHASNYQKSDDVEPTILAAPLRSQRVEIDHMLRKNRVLTRTVMLRNTVDHRFSGDARFSEDYDLWMRMICDGCTLFALDAELAFSFRPEFGPGGQSGNLWKMERAELLVILGLMREKKIGLLKGVLAIGFSMVKYFRRMLISLFLHERGN